MKNCHKRGVRLALIIASLAVAPGACVLAQYEGLVINEFLPQPNGSGIYVDSNNDTVTNIFDDEYIELLNTSTNSIDVGGVIIFNATLNIKQHVFGSRVLPPGGSIVVFGGGSVLNFSNPPAQLASAGSLGLHNTSDTIPLYSPQTTLIDQVTYTLPAAHAAVASTRNPDGTGAFMNHLAATTNALRVSPGFGVHGSSYLTNHPPVIVDIADKTAFVNSLLEFPVRAYDPADRHAMTLSMLNAPTNASFISSGGSGTFSFTPLASQAGQVFNVSFIASDIDGSETNTITLTVINPVTSEAIWINEIHYDNAGTDEEEGFEVAGTAGTILTNYSLVLYNGGTGGTGPSYDTDTLSGTIDDEQCGYGAVWFPYPVNGVQNDVDAVALVKGTNVIQYISYEGTVLAVNGPAAGLTSVDIGVDEEPPPAVGSSLQLGGSGTKYSDFSWEDAQPHSRGNFNTNQTIPCVSPAAIEIQKSVYLGHNGVASCPGQDTVQGTNGAAVTYCFIVINTGGSTLTNVTVTDTTLGISPIPIGILAAGDSVTSYVETAMGGDFRNTATADGLDPQGQFVSDDDTAEVVEIIPLVELRKTVYAGHNNGASCPGAEEVPGTNGAPITYCFEVINNGNTNLTDVTVTDVGLGMTPVVLGAMAAGDQTSLYFEAVITSTFTNEASVMGLDPNSNQVSDLDTASVTEIHPSVAIQKTVYIGHDSGASCPGSDIASGGLDTPVTYCFTVINTGDSTLTNVMVTDTNLAGFTPINLGVLTSGQVSSAHFESSIVDTMTNVARVVAQTTAGGSVSNSDSATVFLLVTAINIQKTVYLGHDGGASCPAGEFVQGTNGTKVTYCFRVTNSGETTLTNVTVTDVSLGISPFALGTMTNGQVETRYIESTITVSRVNTAEASGYDPNGQIVMFSDTAEVELQVPPPSTECSFDVIDLGTLGGNFTKAYAINDLGHIVGETTLSNGQTRAFVWRNGVISNLFTRAGLTNSIAYDINNLGHVVGRANITNGGGGTRGFCYRDGVVTNIGAFSGGNYSELVSINEKDQAAGQAHIFNAFGLQPHPLIWTNGQPQDLGTFSGFSNFGYSGQAYCINNATQLAGYAHTYAGGSRWPAFLWFDKNGNGIRGTGEGDEMIDLAALGGFAGVAYGMNDLGQIVGGGPLPGQWNPYRAFIVTPDNGVWYRDNNLDGVNDLLLNLGMMGGTWCEAHAINDSGLVVGYFESNAARRAFMYDGTMRDLNQLICTNSGWVLREALGVNNAGQIVGYGVHSNQTRGFVLTAGTTIGSGKVEFIRVINANGDAKDHTLVWRGFGGAGLKYSVESGNSVTAISWSVVAPTSQWPILSTYWRNNVETSAPLRIYRVRSHSSP